MLTSSVKSETLLKVMTTLSYINLVYIVRSGNGQLRDCKQVLGIMHGNWVGLLFFVMKFSTISYHLRFTLQHCHRII